MRQLFLIFLCWSSIALADPNTVEMTLSIADIDSVVRKDETWWIKLTPKMAKQLSYLTNMNNGKSLRITLEDNELLKTTIFADITSGVLQVTSPNKQAIEVLIEKEQIKK